MGKKWVSYTVTILIFTFMVFAAIWSAVKQHNYSGVGALGMLALMVVLGIAFSGWTRTYSKLMKTLPSDHKLISTHISAVDIGNFRFIYHTYCKNISSPTAKSYLSMSVFIPFPIGDDLVVDQTIRDSINSDLQQLIDSLSEKGIPTAPLILEESELSKCIGQSFKAEFLLKNVSADFLVDLQNSVLRIVDKYHLQDVTYATIHGRDNGTEYQYHRGNMVESTVFYQVFDKKLHSDYKYMSYIHLGQYDSLFNAKDYMDLYDTSRNDLGRTDFSINHLEKIIKRMFKGMFNKVTAKVGAYPKGFVVTITVKQLRAASEYYIVPSSGYWWFFASGRLDNIYPISLKDEASACDLLIRIISKFTQ